MAISFTKPTTVDNYSTEFVPNIQGNQIALAQWLDLSQTTINGTIPTYAKAYNRTSGYIQEYSGITWANLPMNITGIAGTATTAANGSSSTFSTLSSTSEGQLVAKLTSYSDVMLYNNASTWGVRSTGAGGDAFSYNRSNTTFTFYGNCTGNAGTVTNGVYITGDQTIAGNKTFSNKVSVSNGSATSPSIAFTSDGAVDTGFYWTSDGYINFATNGVYSGNMGPGGNFTAVGNITAYGSATVPSDIRLKTNIARINNALDKVCQLSGYTFDRTDRITARQTGVIAQEVQKVLPEAIVELDDENKTLTVAYGNMIGLMVEAIKELNDRVTDLQNQLANR